MVGTLFEFAVGFSHMSKGFEACLSLKKRFDWNALDLMYCIRWKRKTNRKTDSSAFVWCTVTEHHYTHATDICVPCLYYRSK